MTSNGRVAGPGLFARIAPRTQLVLAASVVLFVTRGAIDREALWAREILNEIVSLREFRPIQPRLSIAIPHAAYRRMEALRFHRVVSLRPWMATPLALLAGVRDSRDPRQVQTAGLAKLLTGDLDGAVRLLARIADARRDMPAYSIDAASAFYTRGVANESLDDLARALQILENCGDLPEAIFGRALVLEGLHDADAAIVEWNRYLALDPDSPWADEARAHLRARRAQAPPTWEASSPQLLAAAKRGDDATVREITSRFRYPARELVETKLLSAWARAFLDDDTATADERLTVARRVVASLTRHTGDALLVDAIAEIDAARGVPRQSLARAWLAYGAGRALASGQRYAEAKRAFEAALAELEAARSRVSAIVSLQLIITRYYTYEYAAAEALRDSMAANVDPRYVTLVAHLHRMKGLLRTVQGEPVAGLRAFEAALAIFERIGEREQEAQERTNLADTLQYLGETRRAAAHRWRTLAIAAEVQDSRRLHPMLSEAADAALASSLPAAALVFQNRLVRITERSGTELQLASALITRSAILLRNGNRAAALRDLERATSVAEAIEDRPTRARLLADAGAADAFAHRGIDDRRAIESLTRALDFFHRVDMRMHLAQLLLARGRALERLGNRVAAERDLRDGIAELETQRAGMSDASMRISYFDRAETLFTELASLLVTDGRTSEAFNVLERARARELLDTASKRMTEPLPIAAIRAALPGDHRLVTFTRIADGVIAFVVTTSELRVVRMRIDDDALERALNAIEDGFEDCALPPETLQWLFAQLLRPLVLDGRSRLLIVADGVLAGIPFAALMDEHRHYLVEQRVVAMAPSATLFVRSIARDRELAESGSDSILLVNSPQKPEGFEQLDALSEVTAEARYAARLYPHRRLLDGDDREAADVLSLAANYDVVQFAGHAVVNEQRPADSLLLIGTRGRLSAAAIQNAELPRTSLVILGACGTGTGQTHATEGAMSLSRAFLAASVPAVIGTIAPVDDAAAALLLGRFHETRAAGADAAAALREAQLAQLRGTNRRLADPAHWSAFSLVGGVWPSTDRRKRGAHGDGR